MCLFGNGFHNNSCVVNPQDLAPQNPGSIFGIMNACGSLPGKKCQIEICPFYVLKGITSNFWLAIFLLLLALFAKGFHAFGSATNPVDIAPKHAGAISGVSYSTAATAGWKSKLILYKYQSNLKNINST